KDNIEDISKQDREYYKSNKERLLEHKKQYNKDNAEHISKQKKKYYKNNRERLLEQRKRYRENNAERIKQQLNNSAKFDLYYDRLKQFEEIRCCSENQELLEVKCAYCGKWIKPTNIQVKNRIRAFNGTQPGESRFYCSENCKQACPIYDQNKYPKGFKQATSREVVPLLRQLVLKRDNYTCQKCGATTETAQLHVHHIIPYTQNKMQANDPDSCITFCKECHKKVHQQDGCKYSDLSC
ncbi:MAG: HNH endonuclease signature motif containing protein, partial [Chloroflexota bacterium]|nr:HNH endonuclease signature motif containing protein [Chloroflexota bacterium]